MRGRSIARMTAVPAIPSQLAIDSEGLRTPQNKEGCEPVSRRVRFNDQLYSHTRSGYRDVDTTDEGCTDEASPVPNIDLEVARGEADDSPGVEGSRGEVEELDEPPSDALPDVPEFSAANSEDGEDDGEHQGMAEVANTTFELSRPDQSAGPVFAPSGRARRNQETAKSRAAFAAEAELKRKQAAAVAARSSGIPQSKGESTKGKEFAEGNETSTGKALLLFQENERVRHEAASSARQEELALQREELSLKRKSLSIMERKSIQDNVCALLERNLPPQTKRTLLKTLYKFSATEALEMAPDVDDN